MMYIRNVILFAAAYANFSACNLSNIDNVTPAVAGTAFVKGQKVTLTVNKGDQTKVSSELVTSGEDKDKVRFKWQSDDAIKVSVGTESATFTVSGLIDGGASAEFSGTMPAGGTTFDVQYPVTAPDLTTQTYSASEAIPHDMMKFTATGCTVDAPFTLTAANAVLRLNLYGIERKMSQIVVTNTSSTANPKPSYTLNISPAVTISSDKDSPSSFFIVVPAGGSPWEFKAELTSEAETPSTYTPPKYPNNSEPNYGSGILIVNRTFITTLSAQSFTAGTVLNMATQPVTTVWAPVNCGYVPKTGASGAALGYPYGKLYQWGRKDGQGYDSTDATYPSGSNIVSGRIAYIPSASDAEKFYKNSESVWNWYIGSTPAPDVLWGASRTDYDPCPEGWRVPTAIELKALIGSHTSGALQNGNHGTLTNIKGKYFDGSTAATPHSGVFLPAAGCLYHTDGIGYTRGQEGFYWSSSYHNGVSGFDLEFSADVAFLWADHTADGISVRCVQE